ncbi:hypothetical protein N1851_007615 [Merluccius polli]|uniref:Uncharacterized protein n=1 Tax=Merluccius polli TaxID=89951 RepID=A0AA47N2R8_MERPO|nr:hypothetical protein N1851_007615 [Merluccius polli]
MGHICPHTRQGMCLTKSRSEFSFKGIEWCSHPPAGSHHGGAWEQIICLVRKVRYSIIKQQSLDAKRFHTILCEVEAIFNDHPITKLSDNPNNLGALTPNHILLLTCVRA